MMLDDILTVVALLTLSIVYVGYIISCADDINNYWLGGMVALWPIALGLFAILYIN